MNANNIINLMQLWIMYIIDILNYLRL
jgi:hypothetical protein